MNEDKIFYDIPNYDGIYSINKNGIIKSEDRWVKANKGGEMLIKGKLFNGWKGSDGYIHMKLSRDGKSKSYKMHQLLAMVFIPNPSNFPVVRHLNDIRDDNRLANLAWGTRKDNAYDQMRNGQFKSIKRNGEDNYMYGRKGVLCPSFGKKRETPKTARLVINLENGIYYNSLREAAKCHQIDESYLCNMLRGKSRNWTYLKYA